MMTANDDHWPSLPPIRTSSYNSRVSCETLNLPTSPAPASSAHAHTSSSASHRPPSKPASKSADASPFCSQDTSPSPSHTFSSCFPHKFSKRHGHDRKKGGTHTGALDATGLLRSIFRFSSPMASYTRGAGPSNWQSPPPMTSSPSGRMKPPGAMSPISSMRSGGATPHSAVPLRSSKGHSAHMHAFTMMPPDVVGKKKPAGYESDEPTSPEVTCIGKVRSKAAWDALVKDKRNDAKKKGKAKRVWGETPRRSDFDACAISHESGESTASAMLSRQRSEPRRSLDSLVLEAFPTDFNVHMPSQSDSTKRDLAQGMDNAYNNQVPTASTNRDACTHGVDCAVGGDSPPHSKSQSGIVETQSKLSSSSQGEGVEHERHGDVELYLYDKNTESDAPAPLSEAVPPSNCLLLMKKGSRNRSAHYDFDRQLHQESAHAINQWTWGQVLT